MHNMRRKLLSQNFLSSQKLISKLVGCSSIGKNDLVLEIGSGKGIITGILTKHAGHVIAIEIDPYWYQNVKNAFVGTVNLTLHQGDFLAFSLPKSPYKVFANVPFSIEGKIIRKLIDAPNPPQDCYLIVMDDLARRLVAPKRENMFSLMHKPWFDFSIVHTFKPHDFSPIPNVTPVLFRFRTRRNPFLPFEMRGKYQKFIRKAFGHGQPIRNNLKDVFPLAKIDVVLQKLSISKKTKPTHLSMHDWICLYKTLVAQTSWSTAVEEQ